MPAKRKAVAMKENKSKVLKMDGDSSLSSTALPPAAALPSATALRIAPLTSSHEKPVPIVATQADGWPNGLDSWHSILHAISFHTLFEKKTACSWHSAICVARRVPSHCIIDLRLISDPPKSVYQLWFEGNILPLDLRIHMYEVLYQKVVPNEFGSFPYRISQQYYTHLIGKCYDAGNNCKYCPLHDAMERWKRAQAYGEMKGWQELQSTPFSTETKTGYEFYADLNSDYQSNPLRLAIRRGHVDQVVALLEHLPALELDVFQKMGDAEAESPEYWLREGTDLQTRLPNLDRIFEAARSFMELYRRKRCALLRSLLSDVLPFDLFALIDAYGAALARKSDIIIIQNKA